MAKNNMTPEQDLITREFFMKVAQDMSLAPDDPVGMRNMQACCIRLLNYDVIAGCFVTKGKTHTRSLGGQADVVCEWEADTERAQREVSLYEDRSSSKNKANRGKPTKNTKVRKAVLREDV